MAQKWKYDDVETMQRRARVQISIALHMPTYTTLVQLTSIKEYEPRTPLNVGDVVVHGLLYLVVCRVGVQTMQQHRHLGKSIDQPAYYFNKYDKHGRIRNGSFAHLGSWDVVMSIGEVEDNVKNNRMIVPKNEPRFKTKWKKIRVYDYDHYGDCVAVCDGSVSNGLATKQTYPDWML